MPVQRQQVLDVTADMIVRTRQLRVDRIMLIEEGARYLHALKPLLQGCLQTLQRVKCSYVSMIAMQLCSPAD